ncbi:hypothetical protein FALBO_14296 [Fusarium albosuccineum]|uniref:Uncharacterized protein n=1 Tax=Fusarium albosuccineum TaxID=1237068 RepID=A0A8H4P7F9_9HYPO|nr:hypothetical protein FALBO_14296 [Fusarium albosuccineum]
MHHLTEPPSTEKWKFTSGLTSASGLAEHGDLSALATGPLDGTELAFAGPVFVDEPCSLTTNAVDAGLSTSATTVRGVDLAADGGTNATLASGKSGEESNEGNGELHLSDRSGRPQGVFHEPGIKLTVAGIGAKEKHSQKTVNDIYTRANNPNVAAFCAADFIFCGAQDTQCVWDKTDQTVGNVVFTCGVFNLPGSIGFNGQGGFANIAVRGRNCNNNANPNRYVCS